MTQISFHYSTGRGVLHARSDEQVEGLLEARECGERAIRALIASPNQEDWRNWILYVSDELGEVILEMPFASILGRLH